MTFSRSLSPGAAAALLYALAATPAAAEAPANDAFAAPVILAPALPASAAGTTAEATRETDEPVYTYSRRSVWYQWTAPDSGWKRVTTVTTEATIDNTPAVAVLTGAGPASLRLVSIDPPGEGLARFEAVAGAVYYFHVTEQSSPGKFLLTLSGIPAPAPPANDSFADAVLLESALPRTAAGTFLDATVEAREPNVYDFGDRASVWYRWVAPAGVDWLDVYLEEVEDAAGVKLYTASGLNKITDLTLVPPRFLDRAYPEAFYQVTPGTVYYFQLYQNLAATRPFTLHLEAISAPLPAANDAFAARVNLGNAAEVSRSDGSTDNATTEPGEPLPVSSLTSTVWYSWTAPATGAVEIRTLGTGNQDTFLGVYTGTALETLLPLAFNEDIDESNGDYNSRVVVPVTAGTVYQIQVGSAYAAWDGFSLTIKPVDADLQPFRVLAFTLSAPSVNVSADPAALTCEVTLSDLLSDPADLYLSFELPATVRPWGGANPRKFLRGQSAAPVLVSGTTYRFTFQLPAGLPPGDYPMVLDAFGPFSGFANGLVAYGGPDGVALPGNVRALTVVNTAAVTPAPALTSFSMTPATVDTTAGDTDVAITVQATGVPASQELTLTLTDSLGAPTPLRVPRLVHDGTAWKGTLTIFKGTKPQVLRPTVTLLNETMGRDYGYANPAADTLPSPSPEGLTITGTAPDRLPPQLRAFSFDTAAVSLAAGDYLLTGTLRLEDENRLSTLIMGIDDGFQVLNPEFVQSRISGTSQNGVYQWALLLDRNLPDGTYYAVVGPADGAGNTVNYSPVVGFDTWPVNLPFRFTIARSGEESAESNWMDAQNFSAITGDDARTATGINADPDRDGIPNLLEFYFGTNPADSSNAAGGAGLPVFSWTGSALRLDFSRSAANAALGKAGSGLTGQFSSDLNLWTEVPITSPAAGRFRVESPAAAGARGFLRLHAAPLP
ncbi:MAG: hypothetical protein V4726_20180 [Verrucomicrobiota bacterium]